MRAGMGGTDSPRERRYQQDAGSICHLDGDGFMDRYKLKFTRQYTLSVGSLFVTYTRQER